MTPTSRFDDDTLPGDLVGALIGSEPDLAGTGIAGPRVTDWGASSTTGRVHRWNEDAWGQRDHEVFVLADGMGGRPGGAAAATAVVSALLDAVSGHPVDAAIDWSRAMATANTATIDAARRDGHERIGAAVALVRRSGHRTHVLHGGDVRVHRLRDGRTEPITTDHTVADELERAGLDPALLPGAERRLGALTCYLGGPDAWRGFSVRSIDVRDGDQIVLSTDGVHRHLHAADWTDAARLAGAREMADRLVGLAMDRSGHDDATVVVLRLGRRR